MLRQRSPGEEVASELRCVGTTESPPLVEITAIFRGGDDDLESFLRTYWSIYLGRAWPIQLGEGKQELHYIPEDYESVVELVRALERSNRIESWTYVKLIAD